MKQIGFVSLFRLVSFLQVCQYLHSEYAAAQETFNEQWRPHWQFVHQWAVGSSPEWGGYTCELWEPPRHWRPLWQCRWDSKRNTCLCVLGFWLMTRWLIGAPAVQVLPKKLSGGSSDYTSLVEHSSSAATTPVLTESRCVCSTSAQPRFLLNAPQTCEKLIETQWRLLREVWRFWSPCFIWGLLWSLLMRSSSMRIARSESQQWCAVNKRILLNKEVFSDIFGLNPSWSSYRVLCNRNRFIVLAASRFSNVVKPGAKCFPSSSEVLRMYDR